MPEKRDPYYIHRNLVSRKYNAITSRLFGLLFGRYDFDQESLAHLSQPGNDACRVYVSFQSYNTPLMILLNLLQKNNLEQPGIALDFKPGFVVRTLNLFKKIGYGIRSLLSGEDREQEGSYEYIRDLLVNRHAIVLSLLSRKLFRRRYLDIRTDSLEFLIAVQKEIDEPIYVLPHIMFWSRNPEKTRGMRSIRATDDRGFWAALFTGLRSVTRGFVRVSPPINLKEEIDAQSTDDTTQLARNLRNRLMELYNEEKRSVLGPVMKSFSEMMEKVLFHRNVLEAIQEEMEESHKPEKRLRKKAFSYFREIAADFSILYVQVMEFILNHIFTKIFHGIHYDPSMITTIREASKRGPVILIPNHRSHMDYLILSYILYTNQIIPPHIVAGVNLSFFPLGKIFRRSGAFFMRRSFKGKKLYSTVFRQYAKTLVNEGYSIEFFIEGGRTRTGKLSFPKMGILKYLMEAVEEGYNKDMIFLPVAINYDRILEESSYHNELRGQGKQKESTGSLVRSRKLLKRTYGSVYVAVEEPVSFQDIRDQGSDMIERTGIVADRIIKRINRGMVVTPFSLVTTALLLSPVKGFTVSLIREDVERLYRYLRFTGATLADTIGPMEEIEKTIRFVNDSYLNDGIVRMLFSDDIEEESNEVKKEKNGESGETIYIIDEDNRGRINFYKNSIIHLLLPLAYFSLAFLMSEKDAVASEKNVGEHYVYLSGLFSDSFVYTDFLNDREKSLSVTAKYLIESEEVMEEPDGWRLKDEKIRSALIFYATAIRDYLESCFIVCQVLAVHENERISRRDLTLEIRRNGVRMYHLGEIRMSESLSMPNYNDVLDYLIREKGLIEEEGKRHALIRPGDFSKVERLSEEVKNALRVIS